MREECARVHINNIILNSILGLGKGSVRFGTGQQVVCRRGAHERVYAGARTRIFGCLRRFVWAGLYYR